MLKVLVPIDGSDVALRAVQHVIRMASGANGISVYLLNVQPALPQAATSFLSAEAVQSYHEDEGRKALKEAEAMLEQAGVPYRSEVAVGSAAEVIAERSAEWQCDQIVMGTRGLSPVPNLLLGSVTTKLLHLVHLPVTLVR